MAFNNPYENMQKNAVFTAPKEELTLMLYDGALKFCNQAIIAVEAKDTQKAHDCIIKVQNIIQEFQLTLNRDIAVSEQLDLMYDYIMRRLIESNTSKDLEILSECRDLIRGLRDTWKEAMKLAKASSPPVAPPASRN